jgi:acetyltransferase-like isoleucine patch superfamily enzyme
MLLGHWPTGPPSAVPARLQMHEGSVLRVNSWAVLGGGSVIVVGPRAVLELEGSDDGSEGVIISTDARIVCMQHVRLGAGTALSWGSQVLDTDHHHIVTDGQTDLPEFSAPVHIGNSVLVGSRVSVLKGVTIGDHSVIGSGAVVTRDVPPQSVVAGNPARVVREGVRWY